MFGYVIANREIMTEEQIERYRAYYCGLCRTLKRRHGAAARFTLNYDMTFLVLLLSSMCEPEEEERLGALRSASAQREPVAGERVDGLRRGHERGAGLSQFHGRLDATSDALCAGRRPRRFPSAYS